jgi:type VI secretion system secreted protein VgrG
MMPSYALPDNKTRSGVKTRSSIGGGGFNEIRFEDKKGSEQIFIHGQKDQDIRILNDCREWIGNDRHLIVKRDRYEEVDSDSHLNTKRDYMETIGRDRSLKVSGKDAVEITGSQSLKVSGAVSEKFGDDHSEQTTGDYYLHARNIVLNADMGLTICVGGNFVTISPTGVTIVGSPMVMINSGGSALSGSPGQIVPPTAPTAPKEADDAESGGAKTYSSDGTAPGSNPLAGSASANESFPGAANAPRHNANSPENKDKKHYIAIQLHDDENLPVAGEPYEIILPDGSTVASGTTDEKGKARVDNIDPGQCRVRFPRRDKTVVKPG